MSLSPANSGLSSNFSGFSLSPTASANLNAQLQTLQQNHAPKPPSLASQLLPIAASLSQHPTPAAIPAPAPGIVDGGCYHPPADDFQPLPPPVLQPPAGGHCGGVSPLYKAQLHNMSDAQLQQEKFTQQLSLLVNQLLGNHGGALEAQQKLQAIQKEEMRRAFGGVGHALEMALYKFKLNGMSDWQLRGEERKQQSAYWRAMLTGDRQGAAAAKEKLAAVHQEQASRRFDWLPCALPAHRAA